MKFGKNPVIDMLSAEPKELSQVKLLEKKAGSLHCPSEDLLYFIQNIYFKMAVEFSKNPRCIDLNKTKKTILQGQYIHSLTERI